MGWNPRLLMKCFPTSYNSHLSSFHVHPHTFFFFFFLQPISLQVASFSFSFRRVHVNKMDWLSPEVQAVWIAALTAVHPLGTIRWTYSQAHIHRYTEMLCNSSPSIISLNIGRLDSLLKFTFFLLFLALFASNFFFLGIHIATTASKDVLRD